MARGKELIAKAQEEIEEHEFHNAERTLAQARNRDSGANALRIPVEGLRGHLKDILFPQEVLPAPSPSTLRGWTVISDPEGNLLATPEFGFGEQPVNGAKEEIIH